MADEHMFVKNGEIKKETPFVLLKTEKMFPEIAHRLYDRLFFMLQKVLWLFFTHKNVDRSATEVPSVTDFIFQEPAIGFFHPLREVAEECE